MNVLLVGHRTCGKTTLGQLAAGLLGATHLDLDHHLTALTGASPAQLIAQDEPAFRTLEARELAALASQDTPGALRLITPGAGVQALPAGCLIVWIWRDGWEDSARTQRARLRPELPWEEELAWMRATREPRWADAAHLRLDISRGRSPHRAARELADLLRWASHMHQSPLARRTFIVPAAPHQLDRALHDTALLGLAGVEIRSDLLPSPPPLTGHLYSLRHRDPDWLTTHAQHAAILDLDLHTLDDDGGCRALDALTPRPLLLSSHPGHDDPLAWPALLDAAAHLAARHPAWRPHLQLKFAPTPASLASLERLLAQQDAQPSPWPLTFLPQGRAFAWLRPWLMAQGNQTNYLPVGLSPHRVGGADKPTPWDLRDWLPHMAGEPARNFDVLIGDPVDASAGDWWHRQAALASGESRGYVKLPLAAQAEAAEVEALMRLLARLGARGVSVTAPHKQRVLSLPGVVNKDALPAANTLVRDGTGWLAQDTDEAGMRAALDAIREAGHAPGRAAVMGRGGVSPAVLRALKQDGWEVVCHASAREGWPKGVGHVTLVVQASGAHERATINAPPCDVWLDLHYQSVGQPGPCALHLNGDVFFEAQARAQRALWHSQTSRG